MYFVIMLKKLVPFCSIPNKMEQAKMINYLKINSLIIFYLVFILTC